MSSEFGFRARKRLVLEKNLKEQAVKAIRQGQAKIKAKIEVMVEDPEDKFPQYSNVFIVDRADNVDARREAIPSIARFMRGCAGEVKKVYDNDEFVLHVTLSAQVSFQAANSMDLDSEWITVRELDYPDATWEYLDLQDDILTELFDAKAT